MWSCRFRLETGVDKTHHFRSMEKWLQKSAQNLKMLFLYACILVYILVAFITILWTFHFFPWPQKVICSCRPIWTTHRSRRHHLPRQRHPQAEHTPAPPERCCSFPVTWQSHSARTKDHASDRLQNHVSWQMPHGTAPILSSVCGNVLTSWTKARSGLDVCWYRVEAVRSAVWDQRCHPTTFWRWFYMLLNCYRSASSFLYMTWWAYFNYILTIFVY